MEKGTQSVRCCWCGEEGIQPGTPVCPNCKKGVADVLPPDFVLRAGRYRIDKVLGKGGFGITYRAWDTEFERHVAIKEYFPTSYAHRDFNSGSLTVTTDDMQGIEKGLESFRREGRHLARVEHPNIPTVYDRFDENNTSYMVMEFLEGKSLKQTMQGKPLPPDQISGIMEALVSALAATHAQGIHHLDIKPDNVIVMSTGRVVLIDFGAARQGTTFGDTSIAALTPGYAPLELQARQAYGPETDIFELGMMLHQMLVGKLPPSANERLLNQQNWEPQGIEEPWRSLIIEATRLRREERPKDVRAWWYGTDAVADGVTASSTVTTVERPGMAAGTPTQSRVGQTLGVTGGATTGASRVNRPNQQFPTRQTTPGNTLPSEQTVIAPPERKPNTAAIGAGVVGLIAVIGIIGFLVAGGSKGSNPGGSPATPGPAATGLAPTPSPAGSETSVPPALSREATKKLIQVLNKIEGAEPSKMDQFVDDIRQPVQEGANIDAVSDGGVTALHYAAALGREPLVKLLLERGADMKLRSKTGDTALHLAAISNARSNVAIVQLLLDNGANPKATNSSGETPLQMAQTGREYANDPAVKARYTQIIDLLKKQ